MIDYTNVLLFYKNRVEKLTIDCLYKEIELLHETISLAKNYNITESCAHWSYTIDLAKKKIALTESVLKQKLLTI